MAGVNGYPRSLRSVGFHFPCTFASFAGMLLAGLGLMAGPVCGAQTAHYSGTLIPVLESGSFVGAGAMAADGSGNIYYTRAVANEVIKETPTGGGFVESTIGSGLRGPQGVAVDGNGNVFIADSGHSRVLKETPVSGGSYTQSVVADSSAAYGLLEPFGVAVDGSGDVFIADAGNTRVLKETPVSGGSYTQSVVADSSPAYGLVGPAGVAVDGAGSVYVADSGSGHVVKETPSGGTYTQSTLWALAGSSPTHVAVDSTGTVYIPYGDLMIETPSGGGYVQSILPTYYAYGDDGCCSIVAVDPGGTVYLGTDLGPTVLKYQMGPLALGSVGIEESPLFFTFDTGGELNSATPLQVLTQGVPDADFLLYGVYYPNPQGGCNANVVFSAGEICFVSVGFFPAVSGVIDGAVNLYGSGGNVIATSYIFGTHSGPQITFLPGIQSTVAGGANGLKNPTGLALDGSGNVYIVDSNNNRVLKETLSEGSYSQSTIASGVDFFPYAVAVDGAGNVYISDVTNNLVVKETPSLPGGYTQTTVADSSNGLSQPDGLAVDAIGNLYITNEASSFALKETPSAGGYTQSTIGSGLSFPGGVAVDGSGNVYIADTDNNRVLKETPSGSGYTQSQVVGGLSFPECVAVDGGGDVYVSNLNTNSVLKETPSGGGYTQSTMVSGLNSPIGVAIDGTGNLYVGDSDNHRVVKEDFADPPSLSFALTADGSTSSDSPQTVTVSNIGSAPLILPVLSTRRNPNITANFVLDSGGDSACPLVTPESSAPGTLAAEASCLLPISFEPKATVSGTVSGFVKLSDNFPFYLKEANQVIRLSGEADVAAFGFIDSVVDSVTGTSTVGQSDSLEVTGWVADEVDGAPLSNVKVYIDGTLAGTPTLGIARYGVAVDYKNPAYLDSGYQLLYSAASLSVGTHAVTVTAIDSLGNSRTFGPVSFTVAATAGQSPPFGAIAYAEDSVTFSSTVGRSHSLDVRGWVADPVDGSPLSNVKVYIDGTPVAAPTLGIATPTVATKYSNAAYAHAGIELLYPATSLALGNHHVTVVAVDSGGRSTTLGPVKFTVAATAGLGSPFGGISFAGDSTTQTTTVSPSDSLEVEGWVADATDGSPLSNVGVYIDDVLAGTPTLGIASPSVAAMYGNPAYGHAKYQFLYPATSLAAGAHWVTVIAVDSGGRSTTFGPNIFTVQ